MCIKITEKSFIQLQKQRIKFFFLLVYLKLIYGKNISDNEHQLIFSIHYSLFGIRIVESEQLDFQKRIYSVFGPYSLFVATLLLRIFIMLETCINDPRHYAMQINLLFTPKVGTKSWIQCQQSSPSIKDPCRNSSTRVALSFISLQMTKRFSQKIHFIFPCKIV